MPKKTKAVRKTVKRRTTKTKKTGGELMENLLNSFVMATNPFLPVFRKMANK